MTDDTHSVLGRYSPVETGGELVTVRLVNFPLQLFVRARRHHDDLMREFALLGLRPPRSRPGHTVPARLLELVELLGRRYAGAGDRTDADRDAAIDRGELSMDLTYLLPRSAGPALQQLHVLMEEADAFCAAEQLLTVPSTPLQQRFRRWFIDQFTSQLAGAQPIPWDGPLSEDD